MLFIVLIALLFDLDFALGGIGPALLVILAFLPFVWGLGLVSAAGILAFKRGSAGVGLGVTLLTLASGVYFPLHLLPGWVETLAEVNPLALAIEGLREALIGGAGLADLAPDLLVLIPASVVSLAAGVAAWRTALKFERRRGSLALY
jgi:ABC-2 type transport system permease protein